MLTKDTSNSNSAIKVLRIATRLNLGGPSHQIYSLCSYLDKKQFETILMYGRLSPGEKTYPILPDSFRRVYLSCLIRELHPWNDVKVFFKILRFILLEKPKILHTHMAKAGALARFAGWICRVPIRIHTYHGHVFDGYFSSWKTQLFIWIERFLARRTHCLIAMGKETAKELVEKYRVSSLDKIHIFYPGLELADYLQCEKYKGTLRRELGIPQNQVLIAMIGRLSPIKRPQLFVKIAQKTLSKNPNLKFLLVGGGEEEKDVLNRIKQNRLEDRILFLGWRSDLAVIYSDVDIIMQCSLNEGTPNVLIEALASAKPVIAAKVGSVFEIVQDGKSGFLVDRDDEEGLIGYTLLLASNFQLRVEMGQYGREFVRERFSREKLVERTEVLYQQLLH